MSSQDEWALAAARGLQACAERLAAMRAGGKRPDITVSVTVPEGNSGWSLLDICCALGLMPAGNGTWADHRQYGPVHVEAHLRGK